MNRFAAVAFVVLVFFGQNAFARHSSDSDSSDPCGDLDYGSKASGQEKDHKLISCEQKAQKRIEKDLEKYERQLKAIQKNADPKSLTGDNQFQNSDHDCFSGCEPSSINGGQCPDVIFTKYMGVSADSAEPTKVDAAQFDAYYSGKFDDTAKKNLCSAVEQTISKNPSALGQALGSCQDEIKKCRFDARDAKIAELRDLIEKDKQADSDISENIEDVKSRLTDGCPDCGAGYSQSQGEMSGTQKFSTIMSALTPVIGMGLNTYTNMANMKGYYGSYNNYLSQCSTIGVPCTSAPGVTPISTMAYGNGSYGGMGGMSMYGGMSSGSGYGMYSGMGAGYSSMSSGYGYGSGMYSGIGMGMMGGVSIYGGGMGMYSGMSAGYSSGYPYSMMGSGYGYGSGYGSGMYSGMGMMGGISMYGGAGIYGGTSMGYPMAQMAPMAGYGYGYGNSMYAGSGTYSGYGTGLYGSYGSYGTYGSGALGSYGSYAGNYGSLYGGSYASAGSYVGAGSYSGLGSYVGSSYYGSSGVFSPYSSSGYAGIGGYSSAYGSQYGSLYAQSGYQTLQSAASSQSQQNLMLAQQQLYSSQLRYQQTVQQSGVSSGYGYGYGGYGYGSSYSPYSTYGTGYSSYGTGFAGGLNLSI